MHTIQSNKILLQQNMFFVIKLYKTKIYYGSRCSFLSYAITDLLKFIVLFTKNNDSLQNIIENSLLSFMKKLKTC